MAVENTWNFNRCISGMHGVHFPYLQGGKENTWKKANYNNFHSSIFDCRCRDCYACQNADADLNTATLKLLLKKRICNIIITKEYYRGVQRKNAYSKQSTHSNKKPNIITQIKAAGFWKFQIRRLFAFKHSCL